MRREDYERLPPKPADSSERGKVLVGALGRIRRFIEHRDDETEFLVLEITVGGQTVFCPVWSQENADSLIRTLITARDSVWPHK